MPDDRAIVTIKEKERAFWWGLAALALALLAFGLWANGERRKQEEETLRLLREGDAAIQNAERIRKYGR